MLNKDQTEASDKIMKFLLSGDKEFTLTGSAGTGKSFMLNHLRNTLYEDYVKIHTLYGEPIIENIVFTALTHKAVDVLQSALQDEVKTLHSFLKLKVFNNTNTGTTELSTNVDAKYSNTLLIIDEASMIDYKIKKSIENTLDNTCKIIYVGDDKQLLAVKSNSTSAFNPMLSNAHLETLVRSASNLDLQNLINKLKQNVSTSYIEELNELSKYVTVIGTDELKELLNTEFVPLNHNGVFLSYTNKTVKQINNYIRQQRNFDLNRFHSDEIVLNNKFIAAQNKCPKLPTDSEIKLGTVSGTNIISPNKVIASYGIEVYKACNCFKLKNPNEKFNIQIPTDYEKVNNVLKELKEQKKWKHYFVVKDSLPTLTSRDARTVHKSQGSTYDFAVIDYWDILSCNNINTIARLLYVAVSRAKSQVYIYDHTKQ